MRALAAAAIVVLALSGCTTARMEGFDRLAEGADRLDVTGIPGWRDGSFAVGAAGTRGHVRRRAKGSIEADGAGRRQSLAVTERIGRRGRMEFDVSGPEVGGTLAGSCRYAREEVRDRMGPLTFAAPTVPLAVRCTFTRDGVPAGELVLDAVVGADQPSAAAREGYVRLADAELRLRSVHAIEGLRIASEQRMGYAFDGADGPVGAVELSGAAARIAVPRTGPERLAAIAAGLALALFWDPGDTDD